MQVMAPMLGFCILALFQWAVPADEVADRMSITLTLVLTAAAYKFAVAAMTPAISYLTLLDKYVVGCGSFILICAFEGGCMVREQEASPHLPYLPRAHFPPCSSLPALSHLAASQLAASDSLPPTSQDSLPHPPPDRTEPPYGRVGHAARALPDHPHYYQGA